MKADVISLCTAITEEDEGFSSTPYLCSEGFVTVGFGQKLHNSKGMNPKDFPVVMSRPVAKLMMSEELEERYDRLILTMSKDVNKPIGWFLYELDDIRQAVLVCMTYQMGVDGVMKFKKMLGALYRLNYPVAAEQMLDSSWAFQTPERASRYASMMTTARLHAYYK